MARRASPPKCPNTRQLLGVHLLIELARRRPSKHQHTLMDLRMRPAGPAPGRPVHESRLDGCAWCARKIEPRHRDGAGCPPVDEVHPAADNRRAFGEPAHRADASAAFEPRDARARRGDRLPGHRSAQLQTRA